MTNQEEVPMTDFKVLLLEPHLRIDEAAIFLDVTTRTVQRYMEQGKIQHKTTAGGRRRVLTESVKKYL